MTKYNKTIVAVVGSVIALGLSGIFDDGLTAQEAWATVAAVATAAGVYVAPNRSVADGG